MKNLSRRFLVHFFPTQTGNFDDFAATGKENVPWDLLINLLCVELLAKHAPGVACSRGIGFIWHQRART